MGTVATVFVHLFEEGGVFMEYIIILLILVTVEEIIKYIKK